MITENYVLVLQFFALPCSLPYSVSCSYYLHSLLNEEYEGSLGGMMKFGYADPKDDADSSRLTTTLPHNA